MGRQSKDRSGHPSDPDLFAFLSVAVFAQPGNADEMRALLGWSPERFERATSYVVKHKDAAEALRQRLLAKAGPGTPGRVVYNASGALCAMYHAGRPLTGEELARSTELSAEEVEEVRRFFEKSGVAQVHSVPDEPASPGRPA